MSLCRSSRVIIWPASLVPTALPEFGVQIGV
jgi:hypothetical protein